MTGPGRRFDAYELMGGEGPELTAAELAEALLAARSLEAHASADLVQPSSGFEDRVMAAIATEPAPRAIILPGSAVRGGRPAAFILTLRNAWAIAFSSDRPMAVRAQAFGLVLVVVTLAGSLTGVAAVGVGAVLSSQADPSPSLPAPTVGPGPATPATARPSSNSSAGPSPSATTDATSTPKATDGTSPSPSRSPSATSSASPSATPRVTNSPQPTATDDATETPGSTATNDPTETPDATDDSSESPDSSDDSGGGSSGPG